jgi:hypothetical protein
MAEIYVRTIDTKNGLEVRGSGLRTGSAQAAADRAIELNVSYPAPGFITKILFTGSFVDPAFADLVQLVQQHGLHLENGDG